MWGTLGHWQKVIRATVALAPYCDDNRPRRRHPVAAAISSGRRRRDCPRTLMLSARAIPDSGRTLAVGDLLVEDLDGASRHSGRHCACALEAGHVQVRGGGVEGRVDGAFTFGSSHTGPPRHRAELCVGLEELQGGLSVRVPERVPIAAVLGDLGLEPLLVLVQRRGPLRIPSSSSTSNRRARRCRRGTDELRFQFTLSGGEWRSP